MPYRNGFDRFNNSWFWLPLIIRMILFCGVFAASSRAENQLHPPFVDPAQAIQADIEAQSTHDWEAFLALRPETDGPENQGFWRKILNLGDGGFPASVSKAKLIEFKELPSWLGFKLAEVQAFPASFFDPVSFFSSFTSPCLRSFSAAAL